MKEEKLFKKGTLTVLALGLVLSLVVPPRAHAYLDPGTGSFVLQALIAGLLGALLALKLYWKQVKKAVRTFLMERKDSERKTGGDV